jgi:subtilisin family serine protease
MAAPQVAGAAALVRAVNPRLSHVAVIRLLKLTAGGHGRWNSSLGWGIVNAGGAVAAARTLAADTVAPSTRARGGRKRRTTRRFKLHWTGRDTAPPGVAPAGIESYRVYVREGRGRYRLIDKTRRRSATFIGGRGHRYSFYVQARDRAGNVEAVPKHTDFEIRVRRK